MDQTALLEVFRQSLIVSIKIAGPILLASIIIGLIIAIFQAATQIHDQTLTFAPKLLVLGIMLFVGGSYMLTTMVDFIKMLFKFMLIR